MPLHRHSYICRSRHQVREPKREPVRSSLRLKHKSEAARAAEVVRANLNYGMSRLRVSAYMSAAEQKRRTILKDRPIDVKRRRLVRRRRISPFKYKLLRARFGPAFGRAYRIPYGSDIYAY